MRSLGRRLAIILGLMVLLVISGCTQAAHTVADTGVVEKPPITYTNGMTDTEKSKVRVEETDLGERITLYDEELDLNCEITLLMSSSYEASLGAELYLVQGTTFNDTELSALKAYLDAQAPQVLLAITDNIGVEGAQVFVEEAQAYQRFVTGNLLGWMSENYALNTEDICFVGYGDAGYFAAYLLYTNTFAGNYLMINPEMHKTTDDIVITLREEAYFEEGNPSLPANIYLLRSGDDQRTYAFSVADQWVSALTEHAYEGLTIENSIIAGGGHNVVDCEALLRGICHFEGKQYGETEQACVDASKAMTQAEKDSIKVGKLSPEHEFYEEVVSLDPECATYINEIIIYDEEINDEFVVHVTLPPKYDETKRYPLVLMTDGVWRLSDHPELRPLMRSGEVENVILVSVGYPNGYDYRTIRERDLLRQPDLYLQFLTENLMPYLCENYSVDEERLTLTGHSYGGYWGIYALFHSDTIGKDTFAYYYIGSPSFQASTNQAYGGDFVKWYNDRSQSLDCDVYVTVGGDEEAPFISFIERHIDDIKKRAFEGLTLEYEVIEDYNHNNVFKPSIRNTLVMFYGLS